MEFCCPTPRDTTAEIRQSWVTLATNDTYAFGALVLGYSLRDARTVFKSTVLVTRDVNAVMRHLLSQVFDDIQQVTLLRGRDELGFPSRAVDDVACSYTKLHVWRLLHLSKGVFLDADTLVLSNCDELFERRQLSAVPLRGWPDLFDTGVFVFQPSEKTYGTVMKTARENTSFDGVDRGVLNEVFGRQWRSELSLKLPFVYNLQGSAGRPFFEKAYEHYGVQGAKIVHFWGIDKPWTQAYDWTTGQVHPSPGCQHNREHLQKWWDVFARHVQPKLARHPCGDTAKRPGLVCRQEICKPLTTNTEEKASTATPCTSVESQQTFKAEASEDSASTTKATLGGVRTRNQSVSSLLAILSDTSVANIFQGASRGDVSRVDEDRYEAWERGEVDYEGLDSFANIQRMLDAAINAPRQPDKEKKASVCELPPEEASFIDVITDQ